MSDLSIIAGVLMTRRGQLCKALSDMTGFLVAATNDVTSSDGVTISHLNTRLFLQVHVTNVIEASQDYDQAVTAYLAERAKQ